MYAQTFSVRKHLVLEQNPNALEHNLPLRAIIEFRLGFVYLKRWFLSLSKETHTFYGVF
jgi:hypothetical protein